MDNRASLDILVVDLAAGMAAALAAQMLARFGAEVVRAAPADDPFDAIYPAHATWRAGQRRLPPETLDAMLARADICIIGGEMTAPLDAAALARRFPRLVILELQGFVSPARAHLPAVDLIAQAATGIVNEQDLRPTLYPVPLASYGAALLGTIGALAALTEREASGAGQVVATSLEEGATLWMQGTWASAERPDALFNFGTPKGATSAIYQCADGKYVAQVFGVPGSVAGVYRALEIDLSADPRDPGLPSPARGPRNYFANRDVLEPGYARLQRGTVLDRLWQQGVAADAALMPGECWGSEEVLANGLIEEDAQGWRSVGLPIRITAYGDAGGKPRRARGEGRGPLAGFRIIDMGAWVAGPFSSKLLCDLGAEVIRVETPDGDNMRPLYRHFAASNRGKRNVEIDLKSEAGKAKLHALLKTADAVVHNLRVGVPERLGIDPESLRAINPKLVTAHLSAYGPVGPKSRNSGFDPILQSLCGHSARYGGAGNAPIIANAPILDYGAGVVTTLALLFGLLLRERTGQATHLDTSLLGTGLFLLSELRLSPDGTAVGAPMLNTARTGFEPFYSLYETAGDWIAVSARTPQQRAALLATVGATDGDALQERLADRPADQWLALLSDAQVDACIVTRDGWAAYDAMGADAGALKVHATEDRYGTVSGIGQLIRFSRTPPSTDLRSVSSHGQDNSELLVEML